MDQVRNQESEKLRMDLSTLSQRDLEELARIIIRKLREDMRNETDRSGHF